jgi:SAM-dependent methyltransferase
MGETPKIGDAFGEILKAELAQQTSSEAPPTTGPRMRRPVIEIVERDDGYIVGNLATRYLLGPSDWWPSEARAVERIEGATLDIGAGAGRIALALQSRGVQVTALDTSPGAIEVARAQGVADLVRATTEEHAKTGRRYDVLALFGQNLGLLGSREQAPGFLSTLTALARPGARIVAQGTDPYATKDPIHLEYQERNKERGRLGGQYHQRVRHLDLTTPYIDYLQCSIEELEKLLSGTEWRLAEVDDSDAPVYVVTLVLSS